MQAPWTYDTLDLPVSGADVRDLKKQARANSAKLPNTAWAITKSVIGLVIAIFAALVLLAVLAFLVDVALARGELGATILILVTVVPFIALALGGLFRLVRRDVQLRSPARSWVRASRWAQSNGLAFTPSIEQPRLPGRLFQAPLSRSLGRYIHLGERRIEFGNLRWRKDRDGSGGVHSWGYIAIQLDRALPHMVLVAQSNKRHLPNFFDLDQRLSLEGNFDSYFRLFVPKQYERDALYIFTPDLMALLIDEAATFDVEIVDDWMFLYAPRTLQLTDRAALERVRSIAEVVGLKSLRRTERYADDRAPVPGTVASAGRRLVQSASIGGAIILVAVVLQTIARLIMANIG